MPSHAYNCTHYVTADIRYKFKLGSSMSHKFQVTTHVTIEDTPSKMAKASGANIACGILALLAFVVKLVLNYLSGSGKGPFPRSNKNVSDIFYLEITPAGWAFSIWGVIYTLNGGYIIYAFSTLFRDFPGIFTSKFFLACVVSDAFNIAWLFAFAYLEIGWSCGAIICYTLGLYTVLGIVYYNYQSHKKELETRFTKDAWAIRILAQNGKYAFYDVGH